MLQELLLLKTPKQKRDASTTATTSTPQQSDAKCAALEQLPRNVDFASPYEASCSAYAKEFNAEVGESAFELFQEWMVPEAAADDRNRSFVQRKMTPKPSSHVTCVFGLSLAQSSVRHVVQFQLESY
jgi:hypothetical protein